MSEKSFELRNNFLFRSNDNRYGHKGHFIGCTTCGDTITLRKSKSASPLFIFNTISFLQEHKNCKRKNKLKVGEAVEDLSGSYLGVVRSIDHKTKTALVKDRNTYKQKHKFAELVICNF